MIAHPATLDVPTELVAFLTDLLAAGRLDCGTRAGTGALICEKQATSALVRFSKRRDIALIGRGLRSPRPGRAERRPRSCPRHRVSATDLLSAEFRHAAFALCITSRPVVVLTPAPGWAANLIAAGSEEQLVGTGWNATTVDLGTGHVRTIAEPTETIGRVEGKRSPAPGCYGDGLPTNGH